MKKIIIGGLLAGAFILLMGMLFGAMSAEMYKLSPKVFWKPMGGDWFTRVLIYDFASGLIFAWVFSIVKGSIPGPGLAKGLMFGIMMFLIGPFHSVWMAYLVIAIRAKLLAVWMLNGLVNYVFSGLIFELIDEKIS